jgi:hypothetical protein
MWFPKVVAFVLAGATLPVAAHAELPGHLVLDEVDAIARQHVIENLKGPNGTSQSATPPNSPLSTLPSPQAGTASAEGQAQRPTVPVMSRAQKPAPTPVSFEGAFSDGHRQSVLYDYKGATYAARIGAKLLNGWKVEGVDGFTVKVSFAGKHWFELMTSTSDVMPSGQTTGPFQAISDLQSPLPPSPVQNAPGGGSAPVIVKLGK